MIEPKYTFDQFITAIRQVETGDSKNKGEFAVGDQGRSIGPFQIQKSCWKDSGVQFDYECCNYYLPSLMVIIGYFMRWCPNAFSRGDWSTCARIWNGGPKGHKKDATMAYADRVVYELKRTTPKMIEKELMR